MPSGAYKRKEEHLLKLKGRLSGSKNPNWKGGIKINDTKKYYSDYKKKWNLAHSKKRIQRYNTDEQRKEGRRLTQLSSNHKRRALLKGMGGVLQ